MKRRRCQNLDLLEVIDLMVYVMVMLGQDCDAKGNLFESTLENASSPPVAKVILRAITSENYSTNSCDWNSRQVVKQLASAGQKT
jgi:hypothetical protein